MKEKEEYKTLLDVFLFSSPIYFSGQELCNDPDSVSARWRASDACTFMSLMLQYWGYRREPPHPAYLLSAADLNSGPHVCTTSTQANIYLGQKIVFIKAGISALWFLIADLQLKGNINFSVAAVSSLLNFNPRFNFNTN